MRRQTLILPLCLSIALLLTACGNASPASTPAADTTAVPEASRTAEAPVTEPGTFAEAEPTEEPGPVYPAVTSGMPLIEYLAAMPEAACPRLLSEMPAEISFIRSDGCGYSIGDIPAFLEAFRAVTLREKTDEVPAWDQCYELSFSFADAQDPSLMDVVSVRLNRSVLVSYDDKSEFACFLDGAEELIGECIRETENRFPVQTVLCEFPYEGLMLRFTEPSADTHTVSLSMDYDNSGSAAYAVRFFPVINGYPLQHLTRFGIAAECSGGYELSFAAEALLIFGLNSFDSFGCTVILYTEDGATELAAFKLPEVSLSDSQPASELRVEGLKPVFAGDASLQYTAAVYGAGSFGDQCALYVQNDSGQDLLFRYREILVNGKPLIENGDYGDLAFTVGAGSSIVAVFPLNNVTIEEIKAADGSSSWNVTPYAVSDLSLVPEVTAGSETRIGDPLMLMH